MLQWYLLRESVTGRHDIDHTCTLMYQWYMDRIHGLVTQTTINNLLAEIVASEYALSTV